ncbi:uncharacterized protein [Aegilops tauschii subsp. strangulata]|uniref:Uncharacterized protein n=2 Tax=Aegilops tauschii TaxID=37682 RepID=A0A453M8H3_AEGTS|nr:uncharacterized protein LOC120964156 [Aegilops tauschii subsp. strangulata]
MESAQNKKVGSTGSAQNKKVGSMEVEMPGVVPVSPTVAACPAAVALVSVWALITPFFLFLFYGVWALLTSALSMFFPQKDAEASALDIGIVCCAALQAAAAVLAMELPCRRVWVRYALAYLSLALTIAGHWMYFARADCYSRITCTLGIYECAAGNIICFLALLLGPLLALVFRFATGGPLDRTRGVTTA